MSTSGRSQHGRIPAEYCYKEVTACAKKGEMMAEPSKAEPAMGSGRFESCHRSQWDPLILKGLARNTYDALTNVEMVLSERNARDALG